MRLTVLGGCGAWPAAGEACSGYLVEHDGFRLFVDPGYATLPRLLAHTTAEGVDAVLISHGHPDHCADLNPLLRARVLGPGETRPLPVYAPPGAADAVLALDGSWLAGSWAPHELPARVDIGPFTVDTRLLPHHVPNLGMRISAGVAGGARGAMLAYTGDSGPSSDLVELARGVDLLLAEATFVDLVPTADAAYLSSARQAGEYGTRAGAARLVLTHLWPGTDPRAAQRAAATTFAGPLGIARAGMVIDLPG